MKVHTSSFKENISKFGREIDDKITYTINNEEIELGSEELNSVSPHYEGAILKSVMKQLDIDSNVEIPIGTILTYQFGVKTGSEYEYINYGNYVVYSVEKQEDTRSWIITCYDKMLYAMKEYENIGIRYPLTVKDYLIAICEKIGLEYEGSSFANSDKTIQNELYLDADGRSMGHTFRDILDEIAQVSGGTICINKNDELEVRYIHDVGELQTEIGSKITATGEEAELQSFELEGKATQETSTQGKNLFDKNSNIVNDAYISANGTVIYDSVNNTFYQDKFIKVQPNTTYTISSAGNQTYRIAEYNSNYEFIQRNYNSGISWSFTTTANTQYIKMAGTVKTVLDSLQIELGSATAYEAFTPNMPSPDYPSELVSVGYENLFNYESFKETYPTRISGEPNNFYFESKGNECKYYGNFEENTTYHISGEWESAPSNGQIKIYYTDGTQQTITEDYSQASSKSGTISVNTYNNKKIDYIRFITWQGANSTYANYTLTNFQIIKGTQIHSYIPYGKYGIEVKTTGKNLLNNEKLVLFSSNRYVCDTTSYSTKGTIPVQPNTTYTLSLTSGNITDGKVYMYDKNMSSTSTKNPSQGVITFTTTSNTSYIGFYATSGSAFTGNDYAQLEKNNKATTYEEYKENTYLYVLNQPLRSSKDKTIKDLAYIKNGMLYVDRKIGNVVLNGTENWNLYQTNTNTMRFVNDDIIANKRANNTGISTFMNNYFQEYSGNSGIGSVDVEGIAIRDNLNGFAIRMLISRITDLAGFKTWLSTHNVEVDYILAEPYTEELGQVQMPSTYESITYIDTTDDLEPNMNITYVSQFEEIDETMLKDINVNFGEKFGPVNTIALSRGGDSDKISLSIPSDLADEDKVAIQITDNQIMNDNNRDEYMPQLLNKLYGLEYYINDFSSTGIGYLDLCDRYRVKIGDVSYKCIMFNDEANRTQGFEELVYTDMQKENEQEYKYTSSTDRGIIQANIIAKKNEATILEYTQQLDEANGRINAVETKQTATDRTISILSTNIDADTGDVNAVTTKEKRFTFNDSGMIISAGESGYKRVADETGDYYYDGNSQLGEYTKDGSKMKDLHLFGVYYYGMRDIDDVPMFVAQLNEDENGEECVMHLYNGGDY